MFLIEVAYNTKKKLIKLWKDYFTVEGTYTSLLPDRIYLKKLYKKRLNKKLNLSNPETYTEKINWLKLYDRRPEYTMMVDKYAVRKYVQDTIGEEYLIPLIGCWDSVDSIDFLSLPNKFVLKCNHDNGVIICQDKTNFDVDGAKKELETHLKRNYYKKTREWPYKNVKRKIICEEYMKDGKSESLSDYKFFCFDGNVEFLFVATNRPVDTRFDFYDKDFKHLPITNGHPNADKPMKKPKNFDNMLCIAEKLSKGLPHARIDLYNIDGRIYFGEITFHHYAGLVPFKPDEWNKIYGDLIKLPIKKRRKFGGENARY